MPRNDNGALRASRSNNGAPDKNAGAPWETEIADLVRGEGLPLGKARDRVILDWLKRGDTRALAALLIDGHVPAPKVRFQLALMLLDDADADAAMARDNLDPELWQFPHRLVIKARSVKRRRSPERSAGDRAPEQSIRRPMPELHYEAAIALVDEAVRAADDANRKPDIREVATLHARPKAKKANKKAKK